VELDQDVGWLSANVRGDTVDLLVGTCATVHDPDDLGMNDLCDAGGKVEYVAIGAGFDADPPVTIAAGSEVAVLLGAAGNQPVVITSTNAYVSSNGRKWKPWTSNLRLLNMQRFACPTRIGLVSVPTEFDDTTTTFARDAQTRPPHVLLMEQGSDDVRPIPLPEGAKGTVDMVACGSDNVVVHTTDAAVSSLWFLAGAAEEPRFESVTLSGPAGASQRVLSEGELVYSSDPAHTTGRRSLLFDRDGTTVAEWDADSGRSPEEQSDLSAFYGQTSDGVIRIDSGPRDGTWVSTIED
jgi:hypothetical protein